MPGRKGDARTCSVLTSTTAVLCWAVDTTLPCSDCEARTVKAAGAAGRAEGARACSALPEKALLFSMLPSAAMSAAELTRASLQRCLTRREEAMRGDDAPLHPLYGRAGMCRLVGCLGSWRSLPRRRVIQLAVQHALCRPGRQGREQRNLSSRGSSCQPLCSVLLLPGAAGLPLKAHRRTGARGARQVPLPPPCAGRPTVRQPASQLCTITKPISQLQRSNRTIKQQAHACEAVWASL